MKEWFNLQFWNLFWISISASGIAFSIHHNQPWAIVANSIGFGCWISEIIHTEYRHKIQSQLIDIRDTADRIKRQILGDTK